MNDIPLFMVYFVVGAIGGGALGVALGIVVGYSWPHLKEKVGDNLDFKEVTAED